MTDDLIVPQTTLARVFGVSDRTVRRWEAEGLDVARADTDGGAPAYDLSAAFRWAIERERAKVEAARPSAGVPDLEDSRARKEAALARLRELEAETAEGKLLSLDDHRHALAEIAGVVRGLPRRTEFLREMARAMKVRPRDATPAAETAVRLIMAAIRELGEADE